LRPSHEAERSLLRRSVLRSSCEGLAGFNKRFCALPGDVPVPKHVQEHENRNNKQHCPGGNMCSRKNDFFSAEHRQGSQCHLYSEQEKQCPCKKLKPGKSGTQPVSADSRKNNEHGDNESPYAMKKMDENLTLQDRPISGNPEIMSE